MNKFYDHARSTSNGVFFMKFSQFTSDSGLVCAFRYIQQQKFTKVKILGNFKFDEIFICTFQNIFRQLNPILNPEVKIFFGSNFR